LIPARYHGKIHEVFDDLVRGNPAYLRMQNPWLTRDGHERMISWHNAFHHGADGQIDRITAVGIDITDQTRMEQQLRESEERYRSVTENLLTGVFIYQDDRFVYCNARVEEILGLHRDLIIGRPVWEVTHPDDREMIRDRAKRRQQGEAGLPTHYSFRVIHSSGETRWLEMTVTTMDYLGRRAILGNVVDITERRAAEAERDALRRRLEQTQRMEALATLVGGIAHDFNNLLVGMMAGTSDVLAQTEPDDPRFKPLGDILQISRRAKDLVSQLLTVGSRGPAAMTRLDINEVIQEALRFVRPTLDPAITLQLSLSSQPATVLGDHNQLWQALTNLCLNARDAMPEGGVLAVTSEVDGDRILVCVSDTGKGIPLEIKERVFEPFFTTKPRGMGIGLGLAVTYGAITNHGGSIDVQDRPGGGTMFRIQLNRLTVAPETTTPSVVAEGDRAGKHTILVVDDEDGVRHVVSRILAREGHIVLTAGNGDETLDTLSRVGSNLQLVILDLELPGRSGAEIFADIRRVLPDTRILLTSGQPPGPAAKRLLAEGAVGFLQKPYDLWELRRAVKSAIGASSSSE
jgi:PAS domain S-box-containing protein